MAIPQPRVRRLAPICSVCASENALKWRERIQRARPWMDRQEKDICWLQQRALLVAAGEQEDFHLPVARRCATFGTAELAGITSLDGERLRPRSRLNLLLLACCYQEVSAGALHDRRHPALHTRAATA